MKIALAQINPTVGDFTGNVQKVLDFAARAQAAGAELVVFPELTVCGYWPADLLEKQAFLDRSALALDEVCRWTAEPGRPAILCGGVLPAEVVGEGKSVRNVAQLSHAGVVLLTQTKMLLPFYDVFDEQRYFEPAKTQAIVELHGQPIAITICEDAWNDKSYWPRRLYAVDPVERLMQDFPADRGARVILNLSASPYWQGKRVQRRDMLAALARAHGAFVAMVNQCGGNDSLLFDGSSVALDPRGEVIAQAASFREDLVFFGYSRADEGGRCRGRRDRCYVASACPWHSRLHTQIRVCQGADRAFGWDRLCAGCPLAVEALGATNVLGIGMPSQYSSVGSLDDARELASNLGISFEILPIESSYQAALGTLDGLFAGTEFGLAEENLQSRLRGLMLMALSNKFGALVLTTGNKSEMSVGYCTLYGDMVGALAVIGDVFKTRVYALSAYANRSREIIPLSTLTKPPSAELRPEQKDTDSLPPYEVLDPILEAYVEHYASAEQIAEEQGVALELVRHILKLVERSEYKRQQAAPVLKVTQKAFGMGRRFPLAVKHQV